MKHPVEKFNVTARLRGFDKHQDIREKVARLDAEKPLHHKRMPPYNRSEETRQARNAIMFASE